MRRVREWFKGGDPDGREKIRAWATGNDGTSEGLTYSMAKPVTGLMVLACVLYPLTKGIGSIVVLVLAVFVMGGRFMIERQVRGDFSDLEEARTQYGETRNPEYLDFMLLRSQGMLEDNKTLTPASRTALAGYVEWAEARKERHEQRARRSQDGRPGEGRTSQGTTEDAEDRS